MNFFRHLPARERQQAAPLSLSLQGFIADGGVGAMIRDIYKMT